jgi:SNF family Na+-dependent transporter
MLVTLGIDSAFGYVDYIMEFFIDSFPIILKKMRKEVFCVGICFACFVSSLMFVTESGYYVFIMFDGYACGVSLYFCLIMECIVIGWIFGIEKLNIIAQKVTGEKIPMVVMLLVKFFIPIFTSINIILYFIGEFSAKKAASRGWPTGLTWLGRMLWIVPIGLAFIGFCW